MSNRPIRPHGKVAAASIAFGIAFAVLSRIGGAEELRAVPKASCGPNDRTESVQGQTTMAERFAPGPTKAFNCNLELIGQFAGEGASAGLDALGNCAYFSITANPKTQRPGVAVLDVANPRKPVAVNYLSTDGMLFAAESVAVSESRRLLVASKMTMADPAPFDVYDISDCLRPVLKSSTTFPGLYSHFGQFTADGQIYYGAKWPFMNSQVKPQTAVFALDVRDPAAPRLLATWVPESKDWSIHSVVLNRDATRAYLSIKRMQDDRHQAPNPNGLAILDLADIKFRKRNPQMRLISTLFWRDSHASEGMQWFTLGGRPHIAFSDNLGAIGTERVANACAAGIPGHGFARLIDLADEPSPKTVSRLLLESAIPSNCAKVMHDPTTYGGYGSYACSVDQEEGAKLLACAYFEGGLRVFDIRDPSHPREVGYYKPPARRTESRPGSLWFKIDSKTGLPDDQTADSVITFPQFRRKGEEIWFTSIGNGFQVVRFSDRFQAANPDLFQ